jgi:hypothetical protein
MAVETVPADDIENGALKDMSSPLIGRYWARVDVPVGEQISTADFEWSRKQPCK